MKKNPKGPVYDNRSRNNHPRPESAFQPMPQSTRHTNLTLPSHNSKANKSDNEMVIEKNSGDEFERYEQNDEAFIEFSSLDDPNAFSKSYSNFNLLQDLDDKYSFNDTSKQIARGKNESETDIFGQLDYILESSIHNQSDIDFRGAESFSHIDRPKEIDRFAEELMMESIDKRYMYEPLEDVRLMLQRYMQRAKGGATGANVKMLGVVDRIIELFKRNEYKSKTEKTRILELFKEIQVLGGLPKAVKSEVASRYPDLAEFLVPGSGNDFVVF